MRTHRDEPAALATGRGGALEHGHAVTGAGKPHRHRQAADPGPDHRHPHGRRTSAGTANAPIAAPPAAATRGRRQTTAFASVSPAHVHT